MNNNEYEPAAVVEIGQAHDIILGGKDVLEDESVGVPLNRFPIVFAKFDE